MDRRSASSIGKYSTDDAKMIGITPAWFTFNGMYVLPPDVIFRPTTRLANWMGIRRCPCSMKTTPTTIPSAISEDDDEVPPCCPA